MFFAPELCDRGQKGLYEDRHVDLWAVGVTLYLWVSGRLPKLLALALHYNAQPAWLASLAASGMVRSASLRGCPRPLPEAPEDAIALLPAAGARRGGLLGGEAEAATQLQEQHYRAIAPLEQAFEPAYASFQPLCCGS